MRSPSVEPITPSTIRTSSFDNDSFHPIPRGRLAHKSSTPPHKPATKVIVSVDYGFKRTKKAFAIIPHGRSYSSIIWQDVHDVVPDESIYPDSKGETRGCVPSASLYRAKSAGPVFGWQAIKDLRMHYDKDNIYVAGVKPRKAFPSSFHSTDDLPEPKRARRSYNRGPRSEDQSEDQSDAFEELLSRGDIKVKEDVIIHFLTWTFRQIKEYPDGPWGQGLVGESTQIVFAVTCPVAWDRRTRAQYKRQVETAAIQAGLGQHRTAHRGEFQCLPGVDDVMDEYEHLLHVNLYTEPEAAARWILARLKKTELVGLRRTVVLVADIGGGTADLVPYFVSPTGNSFERLENPIGAECGSHMLNERFEKLLLSKLVDQRSCLERIHKKSLESIVAKLADQFDNDWKPSLYLQDISSPQASLPILFEVVGLEPDAVVRTSRRELIVEVFLPWLELNAKLMRKSLQSIRKLQFPMTICLIGGGADQPMLQPYLQSHVVDVMNESKRYAHIRFMEPQTRKVSGTFVARGAVLAAGHAGTITGWEAQVNFGMLQQKFYQDLDAETRYKLKDVPRERDPHSAKFAELIKNVPTWIIRQGEKYTSDFVFPEVDSVHVFYEDEVKWPLDETFVALVGDARENLPINYEKSFRQNLRIVQAINGEDADVRAMLIGAGIRAQGEPWPPARSRRNRPYIRGRAERTIKYTVETKVCCKMHGTDLVVTSEWTSSEGTKVTLAQRTLNVAESFSIERIGCYEDRGLSPAVQG